MIKALSAVLMFVVAAQLASTPVAVEREPYHHLVFENDYTRVFSVEVPVGQRTLMHEHKKDYVFVCIGAAEVENIPEGKESVRLQLADGCARFVKAPLTHIAKNLADKAFRNVTIEILRAGEAEAKPPASGLTRPAPPIHTRTVSKDLIVNDVLDNDKVVVKELFLKPDATLGPHAHERPHLVVAVSELHLVSNAYSVSDIVPVRGPGKHIDVLPGAVQWVPAGTHSLANVGPKDTHFISVDFK